MEKQISRLFIASLILSLFSCSAAKQRVEAKPNITFENSLDQCVSIQNYSLKTIVNTTLLKVNHNTNKSIAYCGCKSALAQYQVIQTNQELASGLVDFRERDNTTLTLSNVESLITEKPIQINITCSQPK